MKLATKRMVSDGVTSTSRKWPSRWTAFKEKKDGGWRMEDPSPSSSTKTELGSTYVHALPAGHAARPTACHYANQAHQGSMSHPPPPSIPFLHGAHLLPMLDKLGSPMPTFAMESISSKKSMQGAAARALSKSSRTLASDSPNHIDSSSGPAAFHNTPSPPPRPPHFREHQAATIPKIGANSPVSGVHRAEYSILGHGDGAFRND